MPDSPLKQFFAGLLSKLKQATTHLDQLNEELVASNEVKRLAYEAEEVTAVDVLIHHATSLFVIVIWFATLTYGFYYYSTTAPIGVLITALPLVALGTFVTQLRPVHESDGAISRVLLRIVNLLLFMPPIALVCLIVYRFITAA